MIDAPAPASSVGVPLVQPGTVPFVSCRAGAYDRLLLATHERMMTGNLVACDWLRPVTRGVWHVAYFNQHRYTHSKLQADKDAVVDGGGGGGVWIVGLVVFLLLTWVYVFLFLLWCTLLVLCFYVLWTCPTARICLTE